MYTIDISVQGIAPILQHRFAPAMLEPTSGAAKKTGAVDYSLEWMETMYVTKDGYLYQPATHLEGAMVNAAKRFRIKGAGRKTWKDAFRAYCYVQPEQVPHIHNEAHLPAPTADLLHNPTDHLEVSVMRVKVGRAAVPRARLMIAAGWQLDFTLEIHDDQVRPDVVEEILSEAGRAVGIGDYRPRYGRFEITRFQPA